MSWSKLIGKPGSLNRGMSRSGLTPKMLRGSCAQAMTSPTSRIGYVNGLIDAIRQTTDPKMVGELQARIEGENALLAHESTRIQLLQQQLENDRQVELSRLHERTNANLDLPTRLPALAAH